MAEDRTIQIDVTGQVQPLGARLQKWLGRRAGRWQIIPTAENLLVFSRLGDARAKEGRTAVVQITGSLQAMGGAADIITFLGNTKRSGALVVLSGPVKKTIFLEDGDVRMATSNQPEDRLGALLFRFGMVTHEQLESALSEQHGKRRLGRVLIDNGVITAHDLYTIIRRQVQEIFFSVLLMRRGVFYFYQIKEEDAPPAQINLSTQNLLLEGVRRIDEMSYFREKIPSADIVLERRPESPPGPLDEQVQRVFDLVDGQSTLDEIARTSHLGEFETTRIVFHLMQLGHIQKRRETGITKLPIEPSDEPPQDHLRAVLEAFNRVFRLIFDKVRQKGDEPTVLTGMQSFFEGTSGYDDLFRGATLRPDGTLNPNQLLENLDLAGVQNKTDFLYSGLNELLFFEMFTAGEALPPEEEDRLQRDLAAVLHEPPK